jgi:hypothetical protein
MNLLVFLIALVLVAILVSILWQLFGVGALFARMTQTQRLLVALLGLLIIIGVLWWFFTRYMPVGGLL